MKRLAQFVPSEFAGTCDKMTVGHINDFKKPDVLNNRRIYVRPFIEKAKKNSDPRISHD